MVGSVTTSPASCGTARRVRNHMTTSPSLTVMTIVSCQECGANFQITHPMSLQDEGLARRQAKWLAEQFVWDHIQESKHRSNIELPVLNDTRKHS